MGVGAYLHRNGRGNYQIFPSVRQNFHGHSTLKYFVFLGDFFSNWPNAAGVIDKSISEQEMASLRVIDAELKMMMMIIIRSALDFI